MSIIENFNFDRFLYSLQYMWQGMLSIFLVIGVIILGVVAMNKLTSRGGKKKENKE
ncbi:MAG: OadG family protein [Clostridia bacterium]|nr:OadG family protein [Clostridia bacterium]